MNLFSIIIADKYARYSLKKQQKDLKEANLKQYKKNEVLTAEMKLIQGIINSFC